MSARIVVIAVVCSAIACKARSRRTPDDTLVVLVPKYLNDIDPRYDSNNWETKLSRLVAVGLTSIDQESLEPMLALAESIEPVGELRYRIVLRDDAKFSDGSPVTAEDVAFTFESAMDPELKSLKRQAFEERFKKFHVRGDREVDIELVKPVATLMSDLDFGIINKAAAGESRKFDDGRVVGAGPYMVASFDGERVELSRNPHFFGPRPKTDKILARVVRDENARTLMLVGGSADLAQNAIRIDLVDDVLESSPRLEVVTGPGALLTYLMMNNTNKYLSDVRVRQAIGYALDRQRIVDAKFRGRAVLATGMLPPAHFMYNKNVETYLHDPARAKALLDEAGHPDPDGDGPEVRFTLSYKTSADPFRLAVGRIIASQLAAVGIGIDLRSFEFGTFFTDIKKGNYALGSMQTSAITEPDYYYTYFHSSRIPTEKALWMHNRWRYNNERVDWLVEQGRQIADVSKRAELYKEVQEILARDVPVIPLWHEDNIVITNRDVKGYVVLPNARFFGLALAHK